MATARQNTGELRGCGVLHHRGTWSYSHQVAFKGVLAETVANSLGFSGVGILQASRRGMACVLCGLGLKLSLCDWLCADSVGRW